MYSILLNQVKDLTVEQKADMLQNFMNSNVAASKRGLNIINALFKNYFKDKGIKITDLKLSEVEQFVLSKEFYDQFKETNVNKVFESAKELFSKKAMARNAAQNYEHVIGDIGVAGKTAAIGGYSLKNTDEVLYDNSSGHLGQRDYLNLIISLHNQLNEKTGNTISHIRKTDTDAGLIRGVYNYDKGYLGGYQGNNFSSVSAQDSLIVGPSRFNSVNDSAKTGTPSWQTVIEAQARGYFLDDLPTNSLFDYYAKYFDPYDKTKKAKTNWGSRKFSNQIFNRFFDINEEKHKRVDNTPDLALIRKSLFWDTDIAMIDWDKHYKAVIRRIFERGNEIEKQELIHFYGAEKINTALYTSTVKPYTIYKNKYKELKKH
jgi:hypothetical protein